MIREILWVHVGAGILSLLLGLGVFILRKGDSIHVRAGKLYALMMFIVFVTATYVSIVKHNVFLLLIGFFSFYLVHSGLRVNNFRKTRLVNSSDKFYTVAYALVFVIILFIAFWFMMRSNWNTAIILLVFGATGAAQCWKDVRIYFLKKEMGSSALMRDHIGKMSGSYIAAITAFLVNNVDFLPPLVVWLSPTILGTIVIIYFSKPYRN